MTAPETIARQLELDYTNILRVFQTYLKTQTLKMSFFNSQVNTDDTIAVFSRPYRGADQFLV